MSPPESKRASRSYCICKRFKGRVHRHAWIIQPELEQTAQGQGNRSISSEHRQTLAGRIAELQTDGTSCHESTKQDPGKLDNANAGRTTDRSLRKAAHWQNTGSTDAPRPAPGIECWECFVCWLQAGNTIEAIPRQRRISLPSADSQVWIFLLPRRCLPTQRNIEEETRIVNLQSMWLSFGREIKEKLDQLNAYYLKWNVSELLRCSESVE